MLLRINLFFKTEEKFRDSQIKGSERGLTNPALPQLGHFDNVIKYFGVWCPIFAI